ncbi:MAG: DUF5131 family protein [Deltaproteobacteria bacterium]|nr:DUF5131 family protein [Deltaproteobacteria bacterium]MBF0549242.1 DUF5131 family protein [Deltaproteobacteria bacterium]
MELHIDPEFQSFIPALQPDELHMLTGSILTEGCRDAILTWNGTIIDGHNRYQVCRKYDVPFKTLEMKFDSIDAVKIWIIKNQNARRNLNESQRAMLAVELERLYSVEAKKRMLAGKKDVAVDPEANLPQGRRLQARDEAAKDMSVSPKTVQHAKTVEQKGAPELIEAVTSGGMAVSAAAVLTQLPIEKQIEVISKPKAEISEAVKNIKQIKEATPTPATSEESTVASKLNATNDNIEWAKWTWNPVTGCLHGCKYCYARDIANRFFGEYKFAPHFYPDRLSAPANTTIPVKRINEPGIKNVFVCSMADLFGDWVDQSWIDQILDVCNQNRQWNFIFLTKNPKRLPGVIFPPNAWVGTTVDTQARVAAAVEAFGHVKATVKFLSCEPLMSGLEFPDNDLSMFDWIIIGGRSKTSGMDEGQPKWEWVEDLLFQAKIHNLPVYMKPNLKVRSMRYPDLG